jgi:hypothetical protein
MSLDGSLSDEIDKSAFSYVRPSLSVEVEPLSFDYINRKLQFHMKLMCGVGGFGIFIGE